MMSPNGESVVFQYADEWLANGFSISPLELPLENKLFIAPRNPFYGNFGIFEDSMPDGYGRYLLNRILREQGIDDFSLTPLQRLAIVGSAGMGAVCYEPAIEATAGVALPTLSLSHRVQKTVLYICVSFAVSFTGLLLPSF